MRTTQNRFRNDNTLFRTIVRNFIAHTGTLAHTSALTQTINTQTRMHEDTNTQLDSMPSLGYESEKSGNNTIANGGGPEHTQILATL